MTQTNPFESLERFFEQMNREFGTRMSETGAPFGAWTFDDGQLAIDLVEEDDALVATADLPGFDKDDVTVTVTDQTLRIDAERDEETESADAAYLRHERRRSSTHRTVHLPEPVDATATTARVRNGILTVTLPRAHAADEREVEVE